MGYPTMELPILYALTHPERVSDPAAPPFDPVAAGPLTFEPLRRDDFPAFSLGVTAGTMGGTAPAVYNAANEVAVQAFLEGRIKFGAIAQVIHTTLTSYEESPAESLELVLAADHWARERAEAACC